MKKKKIAPPENSIRTEFDFSYLDKVFRPAGFIREPLEHILQYCEPLGINAYGKGKNKWNYSMFCRGKDSPASRPEKGLELFEMEGKLVLPLVTELVEYKGPYHLSKPLTTFSLTVYVEVVSTDLWHARSSLNIALGNLDEKLVTAFNIKRDDNEE